MYGKCITITWNYETKKCNTETIDTKKLKVLKMPKKQEIKQRKNNFLLVKSTKKPCMGNSFPMQGYFFFSCFL